MTAAEEELAEIKKNEVQADVHVDSKHQTLAGVAFPISEMALNALNRLKNKEITYVQLVRLRKKLVLKKLKFLLCRVLI